MEAAESECDDSSAPLEVNDGALFSSLNQKEVASRNIQIETAERG